MFDQVLAEIDKPQKKFKRAAVLSVLLVSTLFIVVNVIYVRSTLASRVGL
jgi:amino acid transporter